MVKMKLNPDCIRDLMIALEENTFVMSFSNGVGRFHAIKLCVIRDFESLDKYSVEEIVYHLIQLSENGYIVTDFFHDPNDEFEQFKLSHITFVTPKGHEFIASIKESGRWEKTLKILKPLGVISLSIIESVASGVTDAAINHLSRQDQ